MDPNFTLFSHADWTAFREYMIKIGYHERMFSAQIFVTCSIVLAITSFFLTHRPQKKIIVYAVFIGIIAGMFSYPALSHDLFNYIFDAKIFTQYGQNPYAHKALDFPADPTIRFMRWVHRTYPYGPTYLLLSFIPSFLGTGIFSITFFLFKLLHVVLYISSVWVLTKLNNKFATIFAFHPLIIVEGLINTHNDFVALAFGVIGVSLLILKSNAILSRLVIWMSVLVKFTTLPIFVLSEKWIARKLPLHKKLFEKNIVEITGFSGVIFVILYQSYTMEIQSWYFLNLLIFIPYFPSLINWLSPFFFSLVISYYPYVVGGEWGQGGDVTIKKSIIWWGFLVNLGIILCAKTYQFIITKLKKTE